MSDWINFKGGGRPVDPETKVEVMLRNGDEMLSEACAFDWFNVMGEMDVIKYRVIEEADNIESDPGEHYRKFVGDINIDPALLDKLYGPMTGMQFTILKKALRMGKAHKDRRQDLLDIISAAKRELELLDE